MVESVGSYHRLAAARAPIDMPCSRFDGSLGMVMSCLMSSPAKTLSSSVPRFLRVIERAGLVAVLPARKHRLQGEAFAVEAAGRPQHTAMHETAVTPEICAGKQKEPCAVVAGPGRSGGHADATKTEGRGEGHRRAHAPSATH